MLPGGSLVTSKLFDSHVHRVQGVFLEPRRSDVDQVRAHHLEPASRQLPNDVRERFS